MWCLLRDFKTLARGNKGLKKQVIFEKIQYLKTEHLATN